MKDRITAPKSFPVNYLEKRLKIEKTDLSTWETIIATSSDQLAITMSKGNINSTTSRINELEKAINILYPQNEKHEKEDSSSSINL
jgi:protein subunit release factor A